MVIWLTGLSGAGKTTLAATLRDILKPRLPQVVMIDGDTVREAFGVGLGYSEPERREQIQRIQRLAKMLTDQDLVVIVAALYCHPEIVKWNHEHLKGYFEVYIKASMTLLRQRDQKCLYSRAHSGEINSVVGIDIPWHAPRTPHLVINADEQIAPADSARRIIAAQPLLERALCGVASLNLDE